MVDQVSNESAFTFDAEETGILVTALELGIENRDDDVDNPDHEADDVRDRGLIAALELALSIGGQMFLTPAQRFDLWVLLDGDWLAEDPETAVRARIAVTVWTVEVTTTETTVYEVTADRFDNARDYYILGDVMTSDGQQDIVVRPGTYDANYLTTTNES